MSFKVLGLLHTDKPELSWDQKSLWKTQIS